MGKPANPSTLLNFRLEKAGNMSTIIENPWGEVMNTVGSNGPMAPSFRDIQSKEDVNKLGVLYTENERKGIEAPKWDTSDVVKRLLEELGLEGVSEEECLDDPRSDRKLTPTDFLMAIVGSINTNKPDKTLSVYTPVTYEEDLNLAYAKISLREEISALIGNDGSDKRKVIARGTAEDHLTARNRARSHLEGKKQEAFDARNKELGRGGSVGNFFRALGAFFKALITCLFRHSKISPKQAYREKRALIKPITKITSEEVTQQMGIELEALKKERLKKFDGDANDFLISMVQSLVRMGSWTASQERSLLKGSDDGFYGNFVKAAAQLEDLIRGNHLIGPAVPGGDHSIDLTGLAGEILADMADAFASDMNNSSVDEASDKLSDPSEMSTDIATASDMNNSSVDGAPGKPSDPSEMLAARSGITGKGELPLDSPVKASGGITRDVSKESLREGGGTPSASTSEGE